jgi:hypothetical protein
MGASLMTLPFDVRARILQLTIPDTDINCYIRHLHDQLQHSFNALPFLLVSRAFSDDLQRLNLPKSCINTTVAALLFWLHRLSCDSDLSSVRSFKVLARFDCIYDVLVQNDEKLTRRESWVQDILRHYFSEVKVEQSVEVARIKYPVPRYGPTQPNTRRIEIEILVARMSFTVARPVARVKPMSNVDWSVCDFEDNITRNGAQHPRLTILEELPVWPPAWCQRNENRAKLSAKNTTAANETLWQRARLTLMRMFSFGAFCRWARRG